MDGQLAHGWRRLNRYTRIAVKTGANRVLIVARELNGTPLPYYTGEKFLSNEVVHPLLLKYYDIGEELTAQRFYRILQRLNGVKNIIKCQDILTEQVGTPSRTVLAIEPLTESLPSFLDRNDNSQLATRAPEEGESPSIWSPMVVSLIRGFGKTIGAVHSAGFAHGFFDASTIYIDANEDLPANHPERYAMQLSLPEHPADNLDEELANGEKFKNETKVQDWINAADIVEYMGSRANIEDSETVVDLIQKMRDGRISDVRNFLEHPSLWLTHQKIDFILKVVESCVPDQFSEDPFLWQHMFADVLQAFPKDRNRGDARNAFASNNHNYFDNFFGFVIFLRDILMHFERESDLPLRQYFRFQKENVLRRFEGHFENLFDVLILIATGRDASNAVMGDELKKIAES